MSSRSRETETKEEDKEHHHDAEGYDYSSHRTPYAIKESGRHTFLAGGPRHRKGRDG
jgi:hypothetical protein